METPNSSMAKLPPEVKSNIMKYVNDGDKATRNKWPPIKPLVSPTSMPPREGASPFMRVPTEIRRRIYAFVGVIPEWPKVHPPKCDNGGCVKEKNESSKKPPPARRNTISDLMTLNKKICAEIAEILYEERFFVIHVHEGLGVEGGIEFLDAGRQPLQYLDSEEDERFCRFKKGEDFGFRRLKKIIVQIHPATEDDCRHTAINTYFINTALCRLLWRSCTEEKNRITSLKIEFPNRKSSSAAEGRRTIQRREQYWWDSDKQRPRETSIEFLPDIELVLRPFEMLTGCHSVNIELPENMHYHKRTEDFVKRLAATMKSKNAYMPADDGLERKIETARQAMEDYVNYTLHGKGHHGVAKVTEAEMREDLSEFEDDLISTGSDDEDNNWGAKKHDLSPAGKREGGDWKRKSWQTRREWAEEQRVMMESHLSLQEQEDRLFAQAIAASVNDSVAYAGAFEPVRATMNSTSGTKVQKNGQKYESYASALKRPVPNNSSFRGPGRTLASAEVVERTPKFYPAKGDHSMKQTSTGTAYQASGNLNPFVASFSPGEGKMIPRSQGPISYLGAPANIPRLRGTQAPQSGFSQNGRVGSMQSSMGVPGANSAAEAFRAPHGGTSLDSSASPTPLAIGALSSKGKASQSQLDPNAPIFQGSRRRRRGMRTVQAVDLTDEDEDITATEDGEITHLETGRYVRDTGYSATEATSIQHSTLSSPLHRRLSFEGQETVIGSVGDPKKNTVKDVRQ